MRKAYTILLILLSLSLQACHVFGDMDKKQARIKFRACQETAKKIAVACEMYAVDNGGLYPTDSTVLTPRYLPWEPMCPVVGSDTYSANFSSNSLENLKLPEEKRKKPDLTVVCPAENHVWKGIQGPETRTGPVDLSSD